MRKISLLLVVTMLLSMVAIPSFAEGAQQVEIKATSKPIIEVDGLQFKDLNNNGKLDVYEDWRADTEDRVNDLLSQMTMDEKLGALSFEFTGGQFSPLYPVTDEWLGSQDPLVEIDGLKYRSLWYEITQNHVTHFAHSASGTAKEQLDALNAIQGFGESARLGIPVTISTDRPYNTFGSMINMPYYAFGIAHDEQLLYDMVAQYSKEMRAMGYTTIFHSYGVEIGSWYGDEVNNIAKMITSETKAYEENGVHAMTKHYIARGGRHSFGDARSEAQLWENWMVGWNAAINDAGTSCIMMNNSTGLTNTPILYDSKTLGYLRNELGFDGVLCTDWPLFMGPPSATGFTNDGQDLSKMTAGELYVRMLECGIDQFGGFRVEHGTDTTNFEATGGMDLIFWPDTIKELIDNGKFSEDTLNTAVRRILRNKFKLGLFENPYRDWEECLNTFASDAYKAEQFEINTVEDIVRARNDYMNELDERLMVQSSVLMKNDDNILPLSKNAKVFIVSNDSTMAKNDAAAIGAYATVVDSMEAADVVITHVTALDDSYELTVEDAEAAKKPVVLILEGSNGMSSNGIEPGTYEVDNCAAILMQTYQNTPDHGTSLGNFYRHTYPSITADMLFGARTPAGSLVYEIARTKDDATLSWGDLQLDTGIDDATRLYLAASIRNDPDMLVPNNLGDVLYTTNFGLTYGQAADFDFNTLILPKEVKEVEVEVWGSKQMVSKAVDKVQKAGEPFKISFIAQNNGADGYFNADVHDGDQLIASKFVALDAGQFRVVTIELTLEAGVHEISVCGLNKTVTVE